MQTVDYRIVYLGLTMLVCSFMLCVGLIFYAALIIAGRISRTKADDVHPRSGDRPPTEREKAAKDGDVFIP